MSLTHKLAELAGINNSDTASSSHFAPYASALTRLEEPDGERAEQHLSPHLSLGLTQSFVAGFSLDFVLHPTKVVSPQCKEH